MKKEKIWIDNPFITELVGKIGYTDIYCKFEFAIVDTKIEGKKRELVGSPKYVQVTVKMTQALVQGLRNALMKAQEKTDLKNFLMRIAQNEAKGYMMMHINYVKESEEIEFNYKDLYLLLRQYLDIFKHRKRFHAYPNSNLRNE